MKRFLIICILTIVSVAVSAQNKGDRFIGFAVSINAQSVQVDNKVNIEAQAEYGGFVADRLRLGLGLGLGMAYAQNTSGSKTNINAVYLNPSLSRYFAINDSFYYTPELGLMAAVNMYNKAESYALPGGGVYINPIAFELRIKGKVALSVSMGQCSLTFVKSEPMMGQFQCMLNSGVAIARFYL